MNHLVLYEKISVMPFLNLFYTHNHGFAFSLLADKKRWPNWFFIYISIITIMVVLVIMFRTVANQKLNRTGYSLTIGGALGNLVDRICHGCVIDFIDFYVGSWHFATFNIADCSIFIGTLLIILRGYSIPSG